jgi:glutamine synthetase
LSILTDISNHIQVIHQNVKALVTARKVANAITDTRERAIVYCNDVKGAYFDKIRYHVDKLENLVSDEDWSLPKYRELFS